MNSNTQHADRSSVNDSLRDRRCSHSIGIHVPHDWSVCCIGEIGTPVRGSSPRPAGSPEFFNGDFIPWLTVASLTEIPETQQLVERTASSLTKAGASRSRVLEAGTLIIGNSGFSLGVSKILGITCCANDGVAAILGLNGVDPRFLCYVLNSQTSYLRRVVARGNDQPNLNTSLIREITIQYPSLPEQRAIASTLSDVDELIGALDKLIAKKRAIKLATMQQLLTGKTRLPGFNGEWCRTTLGELTSFLSGGTPSRKKDAYWCGDIPWISATSLRCFEIWRSDSNVTAEAVESGSKMAPVGSTLMLVRGSALHKEILCGLVKRPVCFNQDVKALVPHSRITPLFLTTLLRGRESDLLKLVSSAGNTAGVLDTKVLKALEITIPQQDEQAAITEVLTDMSNEIAILEQRRDKTKAIKQGMMQSLLTGRIRLVEPSGKGGGPIA